MNTSYNSPSLLQTCDPILIVDDDELVRYMVAKLIKRLGYESQELENAETALELINQKNFSIIISDQNMPGMSGIDFFKKIQDHQPDAIRILLTGADDPTLPIKAINSCNISHFLKKPWDEEEITNIIESSIETYKKKKQEQEQYCEIFNEHSLLKDDMELSVMIYEELLHSSTPQGVPGLTIDSFTVPSRYLDGDFVDFYRPSQFVLDILTGDVMGKGIPAAVIAMAIKAQFLRFTSSYHRIQQYNKLLWTEELDEPSMTMSLVHSNLIHSLIKLNFFVSLFFGRFNLKERTLTYVDSGSTKPLLIRGNTILKLEGNNPALGIFEQVNYTSKTIRFLPGDTIIFYSDGITDAKNPEGTLFGLERLESIALSMKEKPSKEIIRKIKEELFSHIQSCNISDDLTLIVIKCTNEYIEEICEPISTQFTAQLEQLSLARDFIYSTCKKLMISDHKFINQLQLAINELFCNIVIHGYKNIPAGKIVIKVLPDENGLTVDISDKGASFNPKEVKEPNFVGESENGLGLYVVKQLVDEIIYMPKNEIYSWNHLTIFKRFSNNEGNMELKHEIVNNVIVIKPDFIALDAKEVPEFKESIITLIAESNKHKTPNVVIDMSNLDFIDSSGLGCFLSIMRTLKGQGGNLKLSGMKPAVETIFNLVSMNKAFEIYPSSQEAIKSYK